MLTHNFECKECTEPIEIIFATLDHYEEGKPHKCECGGELEVVFNVAPAIKTASSPNRY